LSITRKGHPTSDGRAFSSLKPGDRLDGARIRDVREVAYAHSFTYDILVASDTRTYFASGVRVGSTLRPPPPAPASCGD